MLNNIFDELNWEKSWREDTSTGVNMMKAVGIVPERAFDKSAQQYNDQCFTEEGKQRTERIIGWLEEQGVTLEGASVLDIGAASGGFSIPFAQRGAQVTAVEPNLSFTKILEENNQKWAGGKINIVKDVFEEVEIKKEGGRKLLTLYLYRCVQRLWTGGVWKKC